MFVIGTSWPTASKVGATASQPTKGLILFVHKAVSAWDEAHVQALSRSFGNFDRVVAQGWLAADALGLPLLDREQAFAFGGRVKHHGAKIDAKIDADRRTAQRRAAKQSGEARQALEAAAAAAEAQLLREDVPMKLPEVQARPRPGLGGKRKRDVAPPEEAEEAEEAAAARPTLAELRRAVRAADAAVQSAEEVARADEARVERARRRCDALKPPAGALLRIHDACMQRRAAAKTAHDAACERAKEREEEEPPTPFETTWEWLDAEVDRIDAEQQAPFLAAEAAVEAEEAEATTSGAAARAARGALADAERAVRFEESRMADEAAAARWEALQAELSCQRDTIFHQRQEICRLRARLRENDCYDSEHELLWEEEPWDEETAARAEEEMRRTSAIACASNGMSRVKAWRRMMREHESERV